MSDDKLGLIFGTNALGFLYKDAKELSVLTKYGGAKIYKKGKLVFICRHGREHNIPPHMINHHANMLALKKQGVTSIISFASTGSLKKSIKPGTLFIPYDYISFSGIPTYHDYEIQHITPGFSDRLRSRVGAAATKCGIRYSEGIYVQTRGPRLETKAEVQFLRQFADVVGMTVANEATLAQELGMRYAALCSVDNYANGIVAKQLLVEEIYRSAKQYNETFKKMLAEILKGHS